MTTTCAVKGQAKVRRSVVNMLVHSSAVTALAKMFSAILEKNVSNKEALCIVNASVSFSAMVLLCGVSVIVAGIMLCWFGVSVYQCAKVSRQD